MKREVDADAWLLTRLHTIEPCRVRELARALGLKPFDGDCSECGGRMAMHVVWVEDETMIVSCPAAEVETPELGV